MSRSRAGGDKAVSISCGPCSVEVLADKSPRGGCAELADIFDVNPAVTRIRITNCSPPQDRADAPLKFFVDAVRTDSYTVQIVVE